MMYNRMRGKEKMTTRSLIRDITLNSKEVAALEIAIEKSTPVEDTLHEAPQSRRATREEIIAFLMGYKSDTSYEEEG